MTKGLIKSPAEAGLPDGCLTIPHRLKPVAMELLKPVAMKLSYRLPQSSYGYRAMSRSPRSLFLRRMRARWVHDFPSARSA